MIGQPPDLLHRRNHNQLSDMVSELDDVITRLEVTRTRLVNTRMDPQVHAEMTEINAEIRKYSLRRDTLRAALVYCDMAQMITRISTARIF